MVMVESLNCVVFMGWPLHVQVVAGLGVVDRVMVQGLRPLRIAMRNRMLNPYLIFPRTSGWSSGWSLGSSFSRSWTLDRQGTEQN